MWKVLEVWEGEGMLLNVQVNSRLPCKGRCNHIALCKEA